MRVYTDRYNRLYVQWHDTGPYLHIRENGPPVETWTLPEHVRPFEMVPAFLAEAC